VVARAIVEDILSTVKRCYPERIPPKTVVWLAVRREKRGRRKGIQLSDLTPVNLAMITDDEIKLLTDSQLRKKQQARRAFNRARFARWCFEAYEQGGVLTHLDLSLLSGLSQQYVKNTLQEYEAQNGTIVPTRGTVHDLGPAVTHKAEVVRRWLRNESPAQIARALQHSQKAVDRYIAGYHKVRLLAQKFPLADLPTLTDLSPSVVDQYVALLQEYEPKLTLYQKPMENSSCAVPAPAGTTARRAGRVKGDRRESAATLDTAEHLATVEQVLEQQPVNELPVGH
jgi:hypothetical protein